ncbi:RNA polymerase sigma factor [Bacillus cereus group sp. BceL300]|uniref:RNA polymerase sigma factor n=1 Tax=Bacillus cereus group TaxID=86661 RepID=UPI0014442093|nr:hypothetical protein [Bacillus cereus]MDK7480960.1 hypothetical protein [Bacillus cereus]NKX14798.1 hypothetical protein [Bacillus cereus]HDR8003384.1 hypothetical protein [Bacillus cereus]HDR8014930.1 hypothetical protein [Bacillus cereus]
METFKKLSDEELVAAYQNGDEESFNELFFRYNKALLAKARRAGEQYKSIDMEDFYSYFLEKFQRAVERFDLSQNVPFSAFFKLKMSKVTYDYVKRKVYSKVRNEDGTHKQSIRESYTVVSYNSIVSEETSENDGSRVGGTSFEGIQVDEASTYDHKQPIEETELFHYIQDISDRDAKIVSYLVQGYKYDEIATLMGREGNASALRNWTKRAVNRIRNNTIEFFHNNESADQAHYLQKIIQ